MNWFDTDLFEVYFYSPCLCTAPVPTAIFGWTADDRVSKLFLSCSHNNLTFHLRWVLLMPPFPWWCGIMPVIVRHLMPDVIVMTYDLWTSARRAPLIYFILNVSGSDTDHTVKKYSDLITFPSDALLKEHTFYQINTILINRNIYCKQINLM